jgi:PAS domain S-box-containing protein
MSTILIAYERESESSMLNDLLTGRGHKVIRSANGIEALEVARRDPPHLMLSDILLPKMDGFALCRKWKQDERLQSIPFIFFTTRHDDPKYERFAEELNADRFLARPSEPDALVNAIDELLARTVPSGTGTERLPVLNEANVRLSAQVLELQAQSRQLVEGEAAYRRLFDSSPCPQWVTDRESQRILLVNDAALDLLGYTRDEFLALPASALEGSPAPSALPRGTKLIRRNDGHSLALLRAGLQHEFRGRSAEINVACDLTEHAERVATLQTELNLQRSILDSGPDGSLLIDVEGRVLAANAAYCALSGYSKTELLKRNLSDLEVQAAIGGGREAPANSWVRYEGSHRHKSGRVVDVEVTLHELPGRDGLRAMLVREAPDNAADREKRALGQRRIAAILDLQQAADELDESALLGRGAQVAASLVNSPFAAVLGVSPAERTAAVSVRSVDGQAPERTEERYSPLGKKGVLAEAFDSGLPQIAAALKGRSLIDGLPAMERCIVVPLGDGDEARGLLVVANAAREYSGADQNELSLFAAGWWRIIKAKRSHLTAMRHVQRADIAMESMIVTLSSMIEIHDPHTSGSASRVAVLAVAIGREMGLDGKRQHILRIAGLLHDIGAVRIPAAILGKPHPLTEQEMALVKTHPEGGKELLASIDFNAPVAAIVEQHHERLDGSGYPRGLKGEAILLEARILAVADVVEAMCSRRAERAALGLDAALEELEKNAGHLYDAAVVAACTRLFRQHGLRLPD